MFDHLAFLGREIGSENRGLEQLPPAGWAKMMSPLPGETRDVGLYGAVLSLSPQPTYRRSERASGSVTGRRQVKSTHT